MPAHASNLARQLNYSQHQAGLKQSGRRSGVAAVTTAEASVPRVKRLRRSVLLALAALAPRRTARFLGRRYLTSGAHVAPGQMAGAGPADLLPLDADGGILRYSAGTGAGRPEKRILLVHGHDGHVRQFARPIRALRQAGVGVDALVLPGHLAPDRTICSMRNIVEGIKAAVTKHGPYDGIVAHCVSANATLFALAEGLPCDRAAFISAPLDLKGLIRLGGTQYGLRGRCLDLFVQEVSRLGAPYAVETPWRPLAAGCRIPLLALHARHDYAAPAAEVEALAKVAPDARVKVFEQGDHNTILNMSIAATALVAFLAD
jgi:alpha-beta hydrolase superfamily lysophospholipase